MRGRAPPRAPSSHPWSCPGPLAEPLRSQRSQPCWRPPSAAGGSALPSPVTVRCPETLICFGCCDLEAIPCFLGLGEDHWVWQACTQWLVQTHVSEVAFQFQEVRLPEAGSFSLSAPSSFAYDFHSHDRLLITRSKQEQEKRQR